MEWTRTETLALAAEKCSTCSGAGTRTTKGGEQEACKCVFRAIFRACYNRFVHCATKEKYMTRVSLEHSAGAQGRSMWGRKDEEYTADFLLVTKRSLSADEYDVFRYHYLLGADWKLCVRKLKIDKGTFFHTVYRMQQKLGRVYRELQPYALFPLDEYFSGSSNLTAPARKVIQMPAKTSGARLSERVPLKRVA